MNVYGEYCLEQERENERERYLSQILSARSEIESLENTAESGHSLGISWEYWVYPMVTDCNRFVIESGNCNYAMHLENR